jgi:glycosyltransferase involved in cell wall biosynthesis
VAESRDIFLVVNSVDELGGLMVWAHDIARLFSLNGHRVRLIGVEPAKERRDYGSDRPYSKITLHDARLPRRGHPAWFNAAGKTRNHRREQLFGTGVQRLSQIFAEGGRGGVIICAQIYAMEWVAAADKHGMPVIGMSHESFQASQASSRYARVLKYYSGADVHLALTDEDADSWAAKAGMTNVGSMPNQLMVVPEHLPSYDDKTIVTLSRLSHEKGLDLLMEAWSGLAPQYPDWDLKVFGAGPEEAELREQARTLGLDDTKIFQGKTSDIDGALSTASVYVLPSRQEGFPVAVMEAMAYGLPTAAFDCAPGIRELIEDEVAGGLVVTAGNVSGLAAALERLMKDRDLRVRLGEAGRQAVQRFSPESIVSRWEALFALLER